MTEDLVNFVKIGGFWMKKIITSVAALSLTMGIASGASAAELSPSVSQAKSNGAIELNSLVTPYNLTKTYTETQYYSKGKYPGQTSLPTAYTKTLDAADGKVWVGTLHLKKAVDSGSSWKCTFTGTLTLY